MRLFSCRPLFALAALLSLIPSSLVVLADNCKPWTWDNGDFKAAGTTPAGPKITRYPRPDRTKKWVTGDVVCRFWSATGEKVNCCTCAKLADRYDIETEKFFLLNPNIKKDCSNINPFTEYCVAGYIQPIVNSDGTCGPKHGNGTCGVTDKPCCNSETWKCGDQLEDCTDGICYEGACIGHDSYTTDGTCGYQNGNRLCAGKWGDCCNFDGKCGTGTNFCGKDNCQSGNCNPPIKPNLELLNALVSYPGDLLELLEGLEVFEVRVEE